MHARGTILLAYASLYGSTHEVAEAVATELRSAQLAVDVVPVHQVASLEAYAAVLLGAAIYNTRWHPEAHEFIERHRTALTLRPLAIFALGPLHRTAAAMARSQRQLEAELGRYPWLKPLATQMFVGKIDPVKLSIWERIGVTPSDERDWDAIRGWARSLALQLKQALALPAPA